MKEKIIYKFVCFPPNSDFDRDSVRIYRGVGVTPWSAWVHLCKTYLIRECKKELGLEFEDPLDVLNEFAVLAVFDDYAEEVWDEFEIGRQNAIKRKN